MQKSLKLLAELQGIDLKADGLRGEKEAVLGEVAELDQKLAGANEVILAKKAEYEALAAEKGELEGNLSAETDNITRSETRLKEIKTQKEYQAVSKEISSARKMVSEVEEQLLQKISRLDELKSEIESLEANLQELTSNTEAKKAELQAGIDRLEGEIAADLATREATVKSLPASVVKRYATLRVQRKGIAVVEARDGSCLGCNMHLPPQLYNLLFRGEELITCPHCHRVLVLKREEKSE